MVMDEIYECIEDEEQRKMFKVFVIENGYHTETIEMDVMGKENESNLLRHCKNNKLLDAIKTFFKFRQGLSIFTQMSHDDLDINT